LQFIFSNGDDLYTAPSRTFTLGNQSLIETITATVNGGATSTDLHVIEPTGILIKKFGSVRMLDTSIFSANWNLLYGRYLCTPRQRQFLSDKTT